MKAVDLRKGKTILYEGELMVVHEASHVAKGNKRSYMQTKLKNFKTGVISDVRFSVDDRLEVPFLESKEYEYLFQEGDHFVLMDTSSYDQVSVPGDAVGDAVQFLTPNLKIACQIYDGLIVSFELPNVVELKVVDCPPVIKGATVTNQMKEGVLETGARVRIPGFVEPGTRIRVDTRSGEYIERAK
jgi:elongation factor P